MSSTPEFFRDGVVQEAPYQFVKKNGEVIDVLLSATAERDAAGDVVRSQAVIEDVTARKQAEEEIKVTNTRLRTLIEAIPDMVIFKDKEGRHLMVNRAVEDMTGVPRETFIGKTVENLLPAREAAECRKSDEAAMRADGVTPAEEQVFGQEGRERHVEMLKAPIIDEGKNVIGLVAIGRDITARKRTEEKLLESETRFRAVFENSRDAIGVSLVGRHVFVNPAYLVLFGFPAGTDLKGVPILDLIAPESRPLVHEYVRARGGGSRFLPTMKCAVCAPTVPRSTWR